MKTPEVQLERMRAYYARRRAKLGVEADRAIRNADAAKYYRRHRNEINERANEKRFRQIEKHRRQKDDAHQLHGLRMSIVMHDYIINDRTRWCGPGERKERELERQADAILKKADTTCKRKPGRPRLTLKTSPTLSEVLV